MDPKDLKGKMDGQLEGQERREGLEGQEGPEGPEEQMDAKDLKETAMDVNSRKLIRVTVDEEAPGETGDLVERLMGKKPELRFQYIQENARFAENVDV